MRLSVADVLSIAVAAAGLVFWWAVIRRKK